MSVRTFWGHVLPRSIGSASGAAAAHVHSAPEPAAASTAPAATDAPSSPDLARSGALDGAGNLWTMPAAERERVEHLLAHGVPTGDDDRVAIGTGFNGTMYAQTLHDPKRPDLATVQAVIKPKTAQNAQDATFYAGMRGLGADALVAPAMIRDDRDTAVQYIHGQTFEDLQIDDVPGLESQLQSGVRARFPQMPQADVAAHARVGRELMQTGAQLFSDQDWRPPNIVAPDAGGAIRIDGGGIGLGEGLHVTRPVLDHRYMTVPGAPRRVPLSSETLEHVRAFTPDAILASHAILRTPTTDVPRGERIVRTLLGKDWYANRILARRDAILATGELTYSSKAFRDGLKESIRSVAHSSIVRSLAHLRD